MARRSSLSQANPLDYAGGGLAPGARRPSGRFMGTSVVLDSSIPLPSDPDPDLAGLSSPIAGEAVAYTPRVFSTRSTTMGGHLPTHSRTARSPSKGAMPFAHHRANSATAYGATSSSSSNSRSGRSSPLAPDAQRSFAAAAAAPSRDASTTNTPNGSPRLRPLNIPATPSSPSQTLPSAYAQYPEAAGISSNSTTAAAGHSTTALPATRPTDSLLHSSEGEDTSHESLCFHAFQLACCFLTPAHGAALRRARAARLAAAEASSPYARYTQHTAKRRGVERDRRRQRQAEAAAAAAAASGTKARSSSDAGCSGAGGPLPPIPPPLFSRSRGASVDDSYWSEDEDSEAGASDHAHMEDQRRGPCCDRPCFTRGCQRTCACTPAAAECCTIRRGACITVWTLLVAFGVLFFFYWLWTIRRHGWEWPPRTHDG